PLTLLLTHLGTVGLLAMVMIGSLYQMAPVVASAPIPRVRLAHVVHGLILSGLLLVSLCLSGTFGRWLTYGFYLIWTGIMLFLVQAACSGLRKKTGNETVHGMRLALGSLFLAATLGSAMAHVFTGSSWLGQRSLWLQVHMGIGLLGWVGGLLVSVSWQVVPMFYLTEPVSRRSMRWTLTLLLVGVILPLIILLTEKAGYRGSGWLSPQNLAAFSALPAVFAVWCFHPIQTMNRLRHRRRKRVDSSIYFWFSGLCVALLTACAAALTHLMTEPQFLAGTSLKAGLRMELIFVWLAVWGWAGLILHGMLTRIVPFLVWFHRFSPLVGLQPTPSVRALLPDRWTRINLGLHLASVLAGLIAIWTRTETATRLTGLLLIATALSLLLLLLHVLRQKPTHPQT
ncbi:MAG: hypothetical protein V2A76_06725, partial [Planctomycetota bacterium]